MIVQWDFRPAVFFLIWTGLSYWTVNNGFKILYIWKNFAELFELKWKKLTPQGITLRGVKKNYPRTFLQKCKMYLLIISLRIYIYFCNKHALKACAKVLRNGYWIPGVMTHEWLPAVWYCREIDSPGYAIAGRSTPQQIILLGDLFYAVWYCGEFLQKNLFPRGDWLCVVWYPGRLTLHSMILRGDWLCSMHSMIPRKISNNSAKY